MGIQNIYFRRSFKGLRRRRQIVFFWSVLIERARKTREGERRTPLLFPRRARASFHRSKNKLAPTLLSQKRLVIHVSQNRCQKAYQLRLQSGNTAISRLFRLMNYRSIRTLTTHSYNVSPDIKKKNSHIMARKCLKF